MNESQVFLSAVKRTPAERAAFLDEVCAADPQLRAGVEALLRAHDTDPGFLEQPAEARDTTLDVAQVAGSPGATTFEVGERPDTLLAGRYDLVESLGQGGMGSVWRAEQTEPVKRSVAVKLIKPGMDSAAVLARFEAERQALALMNHPNIARVFDAGTAPSGRPFFVMELVEGLPITRFCDRHRLTLRQRLQLFVQVCQAVQHAHQKGVIHRDLKPSNVLVAMGDGQPVPKVIDFGVAKATGDPLTEQSLHTGLGTMIGTPEYMSPEQASFNTPDVDTRSDVYSLGVLLYELLVGSPPLCWKDAGQAGLLEFLRAIREEEPPRPSTKLSAFDAEATVAESRQSDLPRLTRTVRGELDWIVMKALEKDRTRRYETANAFAADLQRYLAGEAVLAVPPTRGYRLRKFVRRNKVALLITTILLVAVLSITGSIGWVARDQAARASEAEREREEKAAEAGRELDRQIGEVARLRDRGDWVAARAEVRRIEGLFQNGGRDEQRQRLAGIVKDLDMVDRLTEIRIRMLLELDSGGDVSQAYATAFRDYGIDPTARDLAIASQRVRDSAIREELINALDDWSPVQAWVYMNSRLATLPPILKTKGLFPPVPRPQQNPPEAKPIEQTPRTTDLTLTTRLASLASQADPDEWRNRVRNPAVFTDRELLEELAKQAKSLTLRPSTALLLARVLNRVAAHEEALEILFAAQDRSPTDLGLNLALAQRLEGCRPPRLDEAAGFIQAALTTQPGHAVLHRRLGDLLNKAGRGDRAVAAYRTAIRLQPADSKSHSDLALALTTSWDWTGAIASFTDAIDRGANAPQDWYGRGASYARLGRWTEASNDLAKAVALRPRYGLARNVLAASLLQAGDSAAYCKTCVEGISQIGGAKLSNADLLTVRACGLARDAVGDLRIPIRLLERFPPADRSADVLHALAQAHYRTGDYGKAIEFVKQSRKKDSSWDDLTCVNGFVLALAYQHLGNPKSAQEELKRTVDRLERGKRETPAPRTFPGHLVDWLSCQILRREAEAEILGRSK